MIAEYLPKNYAILDAYFEYAQVFRQGIVANDLAAGTVGAFEATNVA
jgi:hypothetical protein